ncbi:MAG TPA: DUF493 family protein [Luteibaculaceae bacterium]|nr:DUF493 family protein [Luteibaculaceae bacterium]
MNLEEERKLRAQLEQMHNWPDVYMYKFVLPNDDEKLATLMTYFTQSADVQVKQSSAGKYIAITVKEVMMSADAVIERYKSIKAIEGLLSL